MQKIDAVTTKYLRAEEVWPTGGTPLVKEVHSPYFLPVTEEILAEIVRRIVDRLNPENLFSLVRMHTVSPIKIVMWTCLSFRKPTKNM